MWSFAILVLDTPKIEKSRVCIHYQRMLWRSLYPIVLWIVCLLCVTNNEFANLNEVKISIKIDTRKNNQHKIALLCKGGFRRLQYYAFFEPVSNLRYNSKISFIVLLLFLNKWNNSTECLMLWIKFIQNGNFSNDFFTNDQR